MKTKAVRLYGEKDLRLEEFDLRPITDGEILIKIVSDSVCMSTHKTALQGAKHLRVPDNVADNPIIIGHEFCGEVIQVGEKWKNEYKIGDKVVAPPVLAYLGGMETIGYTFPEIGGVSTYSIVYEHIIDNGFLIKLNSDSFFKGSLIEPASCVIRGYKASVHQDKDGNYFSGIKKGGKLAILAGCGPMGLEAIDIALNSEASSVVVTDIDESRLQRAEKLFSSKNDVKLIFTTAADTEKLLELSGGTGYDDVFVYAPVPSVVELADSLLAFDGCLNFFAGPIDKKFSANFNFYNVHYQQHHVAGTSGSTPDDMKDIVKLIGENKIDPSVMITHIGGIDSAIETTLNLPNVPGGKKLVYTHINMPMTAIADFEKLGKDDARYNALASIIENNNGLWCSEAEKFLLNNFNHIS